MRKYLLAVLLAIAALSSARAIITVSRPLYVATTGSDANNCLSASSPCSTPAGAANKCEIGVICDVTFAAGVYGGDPVNIYYATYVNLHGPLDGNGHCIDQTQTVLRRTSPGITVTVQDDAILGLSCLQMDTTSTDVSYVYARQGSSIGDVLNVTFGGIPVSSGHGGTFIVVDDAKVNIGAISITGGASGFLSATMGGRAVLSGLINVPSGLAFGTFIAGIKKSMIDASAAGFTGAGVGTATSGTTYTLDDSSLVLPLAQSGDSGAGISRLIPGNFTPSTQPHGGQAY